MQQRAVHQSMLSAGLLLALSGIASAQQLRPLSFVEMWHQPDTMWRDDIYFGAQVVLTDEGIVYAAEWNWVNDGDVIVIDATDATNPLPYCEDRFGIGPSYRCFGPSRGIGIDAPQNRLWVGSIDTDVFSGLSWLDLPQDPSEASCNAVATSYLSSLVGPGGFVEFATSDDGRLLVFTGNGLTCEHPTIFAVDARSSPPVLAGSWRATALNVRGLQVHPARLMGGRLFAAVAAGTAGVYLLDLTGFPSMPAVVAAHFDWTFSGPDTDGNPLTIEGCDNNGDGDLLDCGEPGRNGDFRYSNDVRAAVLVEVGGSPYIVTADEVNGGHVLVWSVLDVLDQCPGEFSCPDDNDCYPGEAETGCLPVEPAATCPPWPDVDRILPVARYQLGACPASSRFVRIEDGIAFLTYGDQGLHVIDLTVQGLAARAGAQPVDLVPLATWNPIPQGTDTVLENYPCHPIGEDDGCEGHVLPSRSPCSTVPPDATLGYGLIEDPQSRSILDVAWGDCRVVVVDQGNPDVDEMPYPSMPVGMPQGLWFLDFDVPGRPREVGDTLRITRDAADPTGLAFSWGPCQSVDAYRIHRGVLPDGGLATTGYTHACAARRPGLAASLTDQVGDPQQPPREDYYYLVVGCEHVEAAYGVDSFGNSRPQGAQTCR